mmetsp:Transcript_4441/g.10743  ORF Transcript_4441/g.10743 Transcript_4441/m.10743 type:complete len:121 (-) Transcript_4441:1916-2278(-)
MLTDVESGRRRKEAYKKIQVLGSGTYGKCYKVECLEDNRIYVMKRVALAQNTAKERKQAMNEVEVLSSLSHPNIVPYKECFWVRLLLFLVSKPPNDMCVARKEALWRQTDRLPLVLKGRQ